MLEEKPEEGFPVTAMVEGKEQTIMVLSRGEIETITRSRGESEDAIGFEIKRGSVSRNEAIKEIRNGEFQVAEFPLPYKIWEKTVGPFKKPVWIFPELTTKVYYNSEGMVYLEKIGRGDSSFFTFNKKDIHPTQEETIEYELLRNEYLNFLKESDMELHISSEGEYITPAKIIDNWGDTKKVDVFSNITEEQRAAFVVARWVGAIIWMPTIFNRIHGYLRLGHSVESRLLEKQADTIIKTQRKEEEEEEGGLFKSPFKKKE